MLQMLDARTARRRADKRARRALRKACRVTTCPCVPATGAFCLTHQGPVTRWMDYRKAVAR